MILTALTTDMAQLTVEYKFKRKWSVDSVYCHCSLDCRTASMAVFEKVDIDPIGALLTIV
jgi:hypothetical protein